MESESWGSMGCAHSDGVAPTTATTMNLSMLIMYSMGCVIRKSVEKESVDRQFQDVHIPEEEATVASFAYTG